MMVISMKRLDLDYLAFLAPHTKYHILYTNLNPKCYFLSFEVEQCYFYNVKLQLDPTAFTTKTTISKPTHFLYRSMAMTMQMMKTTARTGPTTHMSPSPPVSTGKGSTTSSGVITVSV